MRYQWKPPELGKVWKLLDQYKYVLLVIAVGVVLLLWPSGEEEPRPDAAGVTAQESFDLEALEGKLSQALSQVEGAGKVTVALTVKRDMERVLASDRTTSVTDRGSSVEEETVLIGSGSGQEAVQITRRYPTFQGALVVCEGGDDAQVRLLLTQAVSALTGLGADRITVCKGSAQPW